MQARMPRARGPALRLDAGFAGLPIRFEAGRLHLLAGGKSAGKTHLLRRLAGLDRGPGLAWLGEQTLASLRRRPGAVRYLGPGGLMMDEAASLADCESRLADALLNDPAVLLIDEPAAGLSAELRRCWLARLPPLLDQMVQYRLVVVATRDPLALLRPASDLAVLAGGRLIGQGPALTLCTNPPDRALAEAIGGRGFNGLPARAERNSIVITDGPRFALATALPGGETDVVVGLQADDLRLEGGGGDVAFDASVLAGRFDGERTQVDLRARCGPLAMTVPGFRRWARGERLRVFVDPGALRVFARDGRLLLAAESAAARQALAPEGGEPPSGPALAEHDAQI